LATNKKGSVKAAFSTHEVVDKKSYDNFSLIRAFLPVKLRK